MTDGRPRVFHCITRLLKGGAEAKTIETVLGLDGYDFTVGYGASADRRQVDSLRNSGITVKQFPWMRHYNPVTTLPAVLSLTKYLREERYDIVHTHSTEAGIIGRFAAALSGTPHIVHTVHGIPFTEDRHSVVNRFVLECERLAAKLTDRIVTNADSIARDYVDRQIGSPDQYTTIYSGVTIDSFRDADPATDLPGSRPRVVMVGRLVEGKGFDVMLDAIESLHAEDVTVCLVGEGPLYSSLSTEVTERGLTDDVFLTGYRDDVPRVLAASDILVLPSFREGTPRVITEAMASTLPVIATTVAGIPEQVEDGESGFLVSPGDADELARRLDELLANAELRKRMGRNGFERVEPFSIEAMLDDIDTLYSGLLTGRPAR